MPRSTLKLPGATRNPRPAFPNVNCCAAVKADRSNQRSIVRSPTGRLPLPMRFGRSPPPPAELETAAAAVGVNFSPVAIDQIPVTFQLPIICPAAPRDAYLRPLPNGNSQLWLTTTIWLWSSGIGPHSQRVQPASCGGPL